MAQPVWLTPAGSLGTVPEGIFFQQPLLADTATIAVTTCTATSMATNRITCKSTAGLWAGLNVMFSGVVFGGISDMIRYFVLDVVSETEFIISTTESATTPYHLLNGTGTMTATFNQHVLYYLQAGSLPPGVSVSDNGLIIGVPKAVASLQGVPNEVARDVTSKFAIRAYTTHPVNGVLVRDRIADRTFELTVSGQNTPEFITPPGELTQVFDGSIVTGIQIQYTDRDPGDTTIIKLVAGTLPPGLTITPQGLISGFIAPASTITQVPGFSRDEQGYSVYPFDFNTESDNANYEFVLEVTDGKSSNLRTFSIFVWSRNSLTADNTTITADNTFITADGSPIRIPIILNPQGSLGETRNDNFYAYQFDGIDLDGDPFAYVAVDLPPGLTIDPTSGWMYGYIPDLGIVAQTYSFSVRVYKTENPDVISDPYYYSLTITGPIDSEITWITPSNLGTIANGSTSIFYVQAVNRGGLELQYQLDPGSASNLPQGLQLLPSGDIAGRVSFDTFALDNGTTTFDVTLNDLGIFGINTATTFDLVFTFIVNAYSVNGVVNVTKSFSITIDRVYNEPYENLYIQAMPPLDDRALIASLVQNTDIFKPQFIYRPQDPNFGVSRSVIYNHAYGLKASTLADYYSSLYENHYWKDLTLGAVETAQATDIDGNVIYEVVYSRVIDNLVNNDGQSVGKQVVLPYPVNAGDSTEVDIVYPNSLPNMRDQVIDVVGQISSILPQWMTSKQTDGRILGFVPAWVIAYVKPGRAAQVAYYLQTTFGERLNLIDFEVDRYELDRLLSKNWDPIADSTQGQWVPHPPESTTFDIEPHFQLPVPNDSSFVFTGGFDYVVNDRILILGSQVGGEDGLNDIVVTVTKVDEYGTIETARAAGIATLLTVGDTYTNITGVNITGVGFGSTWDFEVVGENPTVFDGNSLQFIAPVDMYTNTQAYDKYLVFPKRNILE